LNKTLSILGKILRPLWVTAAAPLAALAAALALALADVAFWWKKRPALQPHRRPQGRGASIVIPNWNGRHLLEKYLPAAVAASAADPAHEVIVVDNGSSDGSAEFVRQRFPTVRLIALEENLGFGGGSNTGVKAASNDIVVLLNSDMRVEPDFLAPLVEDFAAEDVFAVSCQIFFSDPAKRREETGLTEGWWEHGGLQVTHHIDDELSEPYPCFYGGGGSCAFHRGKFLELGGFDELFRPFYLEDTGLGYMAWKRGWKVLYEPRSVVYHEHRGTIGKKFRDDEIRAVVKKNYLLFAWKNIHQWNMLAEHFFYAAAGAVWAAWTGQESSARVNITALLRALRQTREAMRSRFRARGLAAVSDTEAFRRPLGGYFRDRFEKLPATVDRPKVLFFSPYPIAPPTHGGGVFMYHTVRELAKRAELDLLVLLDHERQRAPHAELASLVRSATFLVRRAAPRYEVAPLSPHAVREFRARDIAWRMHRGIYTGRIDLVQLEYTHLAQYACEFKQIPCILFEHDIYFQSVGRGLSQSGGIGARAAAFYEYLRALRYELRLLPRMDRIQVCSAANARYLLGFQPALRDKIDDGLRAGIDTATYPYSEEGREPDTMLFLGSFRHLPNQEGLRWFTREVLPQILEKRPRARLVIVGAEPPPRHVLPPGEAIELRGFVEDVREPLARYALFVCPILRGSGMRVKLLEAFAAGIPVVSTPLGAEGLAGRDGEFCALAPDAKGFAQRVIELLDDPEKGRAMAARARAEVVQHRDTKTITAKLAASYKAAILAKRTH
jgi:GT2 family glycosyltransferase